MMHQNKKQSNSLGHEYLNVICIDAFPAVTEESTQTSACTVTEIDLLLLRSTKQLWKPLFLVPVDGVVLTALAL